MANLCVLCGIQKEAVHFFGFPKDEPRRTKWTDLIKKQNPLFIPKTKTALCSKHFPKEHILGGSRKFLMPEAAPVLSHEVLFVDPNDIKIEEQEIAKKAVEEEVAEKKGVDETATHKQEECEDLTHLAPEVLDLKIEILGKEKRKSFLHPNLKLMSLSEPFEHTHTSPTKRQRKKRLTFFGDFEKSDMEDPKVAKKFFEIAKTDMKKSLKSIKKLRQEIRRNSWKVQRRITGNET